MTLVDKVIAYNLGIKIALQIMYNALNQGQQMKRSKPYLSVMAWRYDNKCSI